MNKLIIGKMINHERIRQKIPSGVLIRGICSIPVLKRLERGERLPDYFILERLVERLGKSINKIDYLYSKATYEIHFLRESIERNLEQKNFTDMADVLTYYETLPEASFPLHWQYICKMRAVLLQETTQAHVQTILLLEEALRQTVPDFDLKELRQYSLGEGELVLVLMLLQEQVDAGICPFLPDAEKLLNYIVHLYQDEETRANVYSKAAWVLGSVSLAQHNLHGALHYSLQGKEILVNNGLLLHLPQFLERLVLLYESLGQNADSMEQKKQLDALRQIYAEYQKPCQTSSVALWKNFRQQDAYLISELFSQERKILGQTQEEFAYHLEIDPKTVSRIECGKYNPKPGTYEKLKEQLSLDRDICSTRIVAEDFELLELERAVAKANHYQDYAQGEFLYMQLRPKLSNQYNENKQYIKYMDTLFDKRRGLLGPEDAMIKYVEAFKITRQNLSPEQLDKVMLSRTETFILNSIAICYAQQNTPHKALALLEKAIRGLEKSQIDVKHHYAGAAILYQNLSIGYEEIGNLNQAIIYCAKGILLELNAERGTSLGFLMEQKAFTEERQNQEKETSKYKYVQAYQILKLMKEKKSMTALQHYYENQYSEPID